MAEPAIDYGPTWLGLTLAGWVLIVQALVTLLLFVIGTILIVVPTPETVDTGVLSLWGLAVGFWFGRQTNGVSISRSRTDQ